MKYIKLFEEFINEVRHSHLWLAEGEIEITVGVIIMFRDEEEIQTTVDAKIDPAQNGKDIVTAIQDALQFSIPTKFKSNFKSLLYDINLDNQSKANKVILKNMKGLKLEGQILSLG